MDIRKNPPCSKNCPGRKPECHAHRADYSAWRAELERIAEERRKDKDAADGVRENALRRKDWLRKRGYKA